MVIQSANKKIKDLNEKDYRDSLWNRYCGVGSIPKLGL
jgi:hypothetical protein